MAPNDTYQPMPMADESGGGVSATTCSSIRETFGASETVTAGVTWSACSIAMTLLNKAAASRTKAPIAVVIVQMLVTVAIALATGKQNFGAGTTAWAFQIPPLFALMMVSSMIALQHVTVGTFVVVRNLAPLVTLVVETLVHKPEVLKCNWKTVCATATIAFGVFLYEAHEIKFSAIGLLFLIGNLAFACAERMLTRHLLAVRQVDVSKPSLMVINNAVGALFCIIIQGIFVPEEPHKLYHAIMYKRHALMYVLASCGVGCAISYSGLWLQQLITATSFMVMGSCNKMFVVLFGIVVYHESHGFVSILGAALSVGGSYAYARLQ